MDKKPVHPLEEVMESHTKALNTVASLLERIYSRLDDLEERIEALEKECRRNR